MEEQDFWAYIEQANTNVPPAPEPLRYDDWGRLQAQADELAKLLSGLGEAERDSMFDHLWAAKEQLNTWAMRDVAALLMDGCDEVGFAAFTTWVVSLGQEIFQEAVANPDDLAGRSCDVPMGMDAEVSVAFDIAAGDTSAALEQVIHLLDPPPGQRDDTRPLREQYPQVASLCLGPAHPWQQGIATVTGEATTWGPGPFDSDAGLAGLAMIAWSFLPCDATGVIDPAVEREPLHRFVEEELLESLEHAEWEPNCQFSANWYATSYAVAGVIAAVLTGEDKVGDHIALTTRQGDTAPSGLGLGHHFRYTRLVDRNRLDPLRDAAHRAVATLRRQPWWVNQHPDPVALMTCLADLEATLGKGAVASANS